MKTKWNLTKSEQTAHSVNSERLKSAGVAIGVEQTASSEKPPLRIDQSEYSFIDAGARYGIALALCVRLTVLKSGVTLLLDDFGITIPGWDDPDISLVPPPAGSLSYKVFEWLDLERGAVLNHLIFNGRPLPCGRIFDGILVAQSFGPLPTYFQTGMHIDAEICLIDQLDNPYRSEVELIVERHAQVAHGVDPRKGNGLFAPAMAARNGSVGVSRGSPAVVKPPARSSFEGSFANGIERSH